MFLYELTDWLSIIPILFVVYFAFSGFKQLIKRKNILRVDFDIIILGIFYILVFAFYFLFEKFIVNYRPILINGISEASYPSSTTLLVLCIIPTSIMQVNWHCKSILQKVLIKYSLIIFLVFMVLCRFLSGVHWFSDIIGGILLSISLVSTYYYLCTK